MAQFVVNVTLIVALLLLLIVWAVSTSRRRRRARREHAEERRLILSAFTSATGVRPEVDDDGDDHDAEPAASAAPPPTRAGTTLPAQQLDATSVAALLDLLEDRRRPARRGMIAGLFTSPRSVWSAGTRAGQSIGRYTMGESEHGHHTSNADLYREAAGELVDIHAHDPNEARSQYATYAAAIGDRALAELYVRSAAYATYADHDQVAKVAKVVTDITNAPAAPKPQDVG